MAEEDNPFESPRLLLAGAARHIETFKAEVEKLKKGGWMEPAMLPSGEIDVRVKAIVPPEMKQIVFDIMNNLRSALDHAVFASVFVLTGKEADGTKFPIGDTAKDARDNAKRKCKHVPSEMVDFLLAFEVHKDGNAVVWGLNKLRNTKSHRVLVPCAAETSLAGVGDPTPGALASHEFDPSTGRFKPNLQLTPGTHLGAIIYNFRLEILIGTGTFRGQPAAGIFDRMLSEVERIVSAVEAETARLMG